MNPKTKNILMNLFVVLGTIIVISYIGSSFMSSRLYENFTSLSPGGYPCTQNTLPLEGWYKKKAGANVSDMSMEDQYKKYPVYPAKSTNNNNQKYWEQPDNGKCSPPDMCGNVYESQSMPIINSPNPLPFSTENRVNFFKSDAELDAESDE